MLAKTLEINWHDGQAIYSVDFSPDKSRYATAGADCSVRIWSIHKKAEDGAPSTTTDNKKQNQSKQLVDSLPVNIDFLSELKRHSSPVNVVRFSPGGEYIASAGDDACIIIWKLSPSKEPSFGGDHSDYEKETWSVVNMFYGHNKEIYDLAWSPCGHYFITASIDNTARVWSLIERTCIHVFADHTHYVQGVSWDPLGQYVSTQSSDRSMAIYKYRKGPNGKPVFGACSRKFTRMDKGKIAEDSTTGSYRLYHDENLVSFFRRLSFSPDGGLLITPAGLSKPTETNEEENQMDLDDIGEELSNCAYIYPRNTILKYPIASIGNHPKPSIAIRWCPMLFKKRNMSSMFSLPYRMIYAVATQDSVYIYDTQQSRPICAISGMHFASITDLTWSYDGSLLMFSSADGYCSVAVFSNNELGIKYEKPIEAIQEYDIEMMDIPVNAEVQQPTQQIKTTVATWTTSKPQKRRVSLIQVIPASQSATTPVNNATSNPKKRRITPILVSSSGSSTPMQPPPP